MKNSEVINWYCNSDEKSKENVGNKFKQTNHDFDCSTRGLVLKITQ